MTAATLIYIKSRSLLPKPENPAEESPEKQLLHTLIEYEKIQKISKMLQEMEYTELLLWRRLEIEREFHQPRVRPERSIGLPAGGNIFCHRQKERKRAIPLYFLEKLFHRRQTGGNPAAAGEQTAFSISAPTCAKLDSIEEILVSFFTLLEMVKRHLLDCRAGSSCSAPFPCIPNEAGKLDN